ncbi:MAG TPA: ABC transporter ATP-binding protein [Alphaproteobacteria bacterium]|nr:ABC transporter ATP-binding protein [Alphaproteobacteria bacterium]HNS44392.1 ABC transporter ATP-binding protein [Alphaproteobacteria bacterium]
MTKIDFPRNAIPFLGWFLRSQTCWQKWATILLLVITASVVISNVVMMYGFKLLVDAIPETSPQELWNKAEVPFWIVVGCCAFHLVMYRMRDVVDMHFTPYIQNALREIIMSNLMRHSQEYFLNRFSGELANKVSNVITAYRSLLWERIIHGFIPTAAAILSSCVLLWVIDPVLAALLLVITLAMVASMIFVGPPLGRASANLADREADVSGQVVDTLTNVSSVKNFANTAHEIRMLQNVQFPYVRAYKSLVWWEILFWGLFDTFICTLVIGSVWYLIRYNDTNGFTPGDISVCILIAWDSWYRMAHLSWHLTQLSGDVGRLQSALNEFVVPIGVRDKEGVQEFTPASGKIEIRNIGFSYDSGHHVFNGFNLSIPSSQKVGLVGLSGAGKTTLCQLLLRNYELDGGEILIGGQNIAAVAQESLRRKIAVIPQDPSLFHRSLRDNIAYGRPDASENEIIAAAKAAQAHDFILKTPDGYNTMVGERGVKLSGGQRQRIAIARAILKDAPFLILDEATSSLDSDTEHTIQEALGTAMKGRTTLVIAHRLSTLAHLDRLVVLKDGQIIEDGTLEDLIAAGGHFAYLWNLQAGGFLPEKL